MSQTASPAGSMGIGELSRRTGIKIETIRFYEKEGLVPKPERSAGGHRRYPDATRRRLLFVRRARDLGFGLEEIRQLLALSHDAHDSATSALARRHLDELHAKIADLKRLEQSLEALTRRRATARIDESPVIDALNNDPPRSSRHGAAAMRIRVG